MTPVYPVQQPTRCDFTNDEVATLAYQLWEQRGDHRHDSPTEDWFEAERILRNRENEEVFSQAA